MTNSVYFDGAELQSLAGSIEKSSAATGKLVQMAVRKTALDIERNAKTIAPVDTGNLKGSIGHSDLRTIGTSGSAEAEVGPTANYAMYQEFGTTTMAPSAFMGPSLDRYSGTFEEVLAQIAEQAASG